ncbi:MAG: PLP-dependent aminotransferase family protein [Verrucomicrobiia bacterium]
MKPQVLSKMGRRTVEPPISWLMHAALSRPKLISLAAGFTDSASLPVAEARAALNRVLRSPKTGRPALQYGSTAGDPALRKLTAEYLRKLDEVVATPSSQTGRRGVAATYSPERLLITSGSQQLLYLTTEALCDEGDIVLVEDPTYFVFLGILQSRGLRARGVRLERDGLDLAHLESVLQSLERSGELRRVKMIYLVSYFQNPTGVTTSFQKKRGLLKLLKKFERAAGHPIYLLEDAAYRELRFQKDNQVQSSVSTPSPRPSGERAGARGCEFENHWTPHPAPLLDWRGEGEVKYALAVPGAADRVIYAGTFTKPFATGARVGYGVLPEPVFSAVKHIKGNHDFGTANLLQQLFVRALASGIYGRQVARLQKRYAHKARVMKRAIKKHFPSAVEWWEPEGGMYFWARLPRNVPTGVKSKVFQTALKNDVLYVPGEICYADDPARRKPNHEMRISFGNASEADIREGIKRLGAVLRKLPEIARSGRAPVRLETSKDDKLLNIQRRNKIWSGLDVAKSR